MLAYCHVFRQRKTTDSGGHTILIILVLLLIIITIIIIIRIIISSITIMIAHFSFLPSLLMQDSSGLPSQTLTLNRRWMMDRFVIIRTLFNPFFPSNKLYKFIY